MILQLFSTELCAGKVFSLRPGLSGPAVAKFSSIQMGITAEARICLLFLSVSWSDSYSVITFGLHDLDSDHSPEKNLGNRCVCSHLWGSVSQHV